MNNSDFEKIENLKRKIENDMTGYGAKPKMVKAALLAAEDIFLTLFSVPGVSIKDCKVIRNTQKLAIEISFEKNKEVENRLKNPEEAIILHRVCKNMGYKLTFDSKGDYATVHILFEKYPQFRDNILFALKFLGDDKKHLVKGSILHVTSIILTLILPYLTGRMIVAYTDNAFTQVIVTTATILALRTAFALIFHSAGICYGNTSDWLSKHLRKNVINEFFKIKDEAIEATGAGTFVRRVFEDADVVSGGLTLMSDMSTDALYYLGVMIASLAISPTVFFAEVAILVMLLLLEKRRGFRLDVDMRKATVTGDESSGITLDLIQGVQEVKLLNGKNALSDKLEKSMEKFRRLSENARIRSEKSMMLSETLTALGYALVMFYLGKSIHDETMSIPDALILFNYYSIIGMPLVELIQKFIDFKKSFCISCERVRSVIEGFEFPKEKNGDYKLTDAKGDFCLKDVSFAYNHDNPLTKDIMIFDKINLEIKAGSTVAFVGKSGSGKTTLLKLLAAQRTCNGGTITIDGIDYTDLDKTSLYDNISVINQSPHIFDASIKDNMLYANLDASMEEIESACKKAFLFDDIKKMEDGFDTMLGENGVMLSGGQCQRLALARAFLRDTPIIILDEATSALDNVTQEAVMKTIAELDGERTVIIVAHRLTTVQNADKIFVVADRGIKDSGTHEELILRSPEYKELYLSEGEGKN